MRIGLVFDIREDYGLEASDVTFCDFNYLSDMQYLQNTLEQSGHYVLPRWVAPQLCPHASRG